MEDATNKLRFSVRRQTAALLWITAGCMLLAQLLPTGLLAADSNVNVEVCRPPSSPVIISPEEGFTTDQSSVLVQGNAAANATVYAARNGSEIGFVTADGTGSYSISVSLAVGANSLQTTVKNSCGVSASSSPVNGTRQAVPPPSVPPAAPTAPNQPEPQTSTSSRDTPPQAITAPPGQTAQQSPVDTSSPQPVGTVPVFLEPQDGLITNQQSILVKGHTTPNTKVRVMVNERTLAEVLSDEEGAFAVSVLLQNGVNRIILIANPGPDETRSRTNTVIYQPAALSAPTKPGTSILLPILILIGIAGILLSAWLLLRHRLRQKQAAVAAANVVRPSDTPKY